jgi:aspartate kinase
MGVKARSWLGWQVPIETSSVHGSARIEGVPADEMKRAIEAGEVAVVAGFQGVAAGKRISTLGRGGSDTSAVAVAAGIKAARCDIYTDVDGVYTTDPRIVPRARRLEKIAFEEMLEMASLGAKVLQTRSVEIAMLYRVPTRVLSTFTPDVGGTLLCDEEDIVEKKPVTGIAYSRDEAKITLHKIPDRPGIAASIFGPLAEGGVNVDMIVQNVSEDGKKTDLTFTVSRSELARALAAIETHAAAIGYRDVSHAADVAKVSIIGIGMRAHPGVAQMMFRTLSDKGINIQVISTSEIKVSVLIAEEYVELAVRALHSAYELDAA